MELLLFIPWWLWECVARRERAARTDAPRVPWPLNMAMWIATARVGCHELDLPNRYHYHQNKVIKYDEGRT